MRRAEILSVILLCLGCSPAYSQVQGYICTEPGTTLKYRRTAADSDRIFWDQTTRIDSVNSLKDGTLEVNCTSTIEPVTEKYPVKAPLNSTTLVSPDGTLILDVSEAVYQVTRQHFPSVNFKKNESLTYLGADLKPGTTLEDIHSEVSFASVRVRLEYTERSVVKEETVTVPAGTFKCIVVKEHKLEKAPLYKRERITYTWYAPGVGAVRHDTFLTNGRQESTERLQAITR